MEPNQELAEAIAAQSDELWSHLPADEVDDMEPLEFKTDDEGRLMVQTRFARYKLQERRALRWRPDVDGGGYLELFHNRQLVVSKHFGLGEDPSAHRDWN